MNSLKLLYERCGVKPHLLPFAVIGLINSKKISKYDFD